MSAVTHFFLSLLAFSQVLAVRRYFPVAACGKFSERFTCCNGAAWREWEEGFLFSVFFFRFVRGVSIAGTTFYIASLSHSGALDGALSFLRGSFLGFAGDVPFNHMGLFEEDGVQSLPYFNLHIA